MLSASRLTSNDPAAVSAQVGIGVAVSFTDLLLLPARRHLAEARFALTRQQVADATLRLAQQVEAAWVRAVGAAQLVGLRQRIAEAAAASAQLAQRYFAAGNISARALAAEKAAAAQAALELAEAEAEAQTSRSALNRLMGLRAAESRWTLVPELPPLAAEEPPLETLQDLALHSRLDLAAAEGNADAVARASGLARRTRWLGPLTVGVEREKETDGSRLLGPTLSWEIPLFNWGTGRLARAQAELDRAEAEAAGKALDVSNEVETAYRAVAAARSMALRYRTELIPQREAVVTEAQRQMNFMLIGTFEVLAARQQEYEAVAGYLRSLRDYWSARSQLALAIGRQLPNTPAATTPPAAAIPAPSDHHSVETP